MRKLTLFTRGAAIVVSSFISFAPTQKAEAAVIYPWCAHYGGGRLAVGAVRNCGFLTWAQCMATIAGNGRLLRWKPVVGRPVPRCSGGAHDIPPRVQWTERGKRRSTPARPGRRGE